MVMYVRAAEQRMSRMNRAMLILQASKKNRNYGSIYEAEHDFWYNGSG